MPKHAMEQRRLAYRGREFHFVSYEGQPANPRRNEPATEAAWWLMSAGKRWEVTPWRPDQTEPELDRLFTEWLEANVFQSREPNAE